VSFVKYILFVLFSAVIVFSFVSEKPVLGYGDEFRIFYYHVPAAFVCFTAFIFNLVFSIKFLRRRNTVDDLKAVSAAEIGLVFGVLATVTGAIFAKISWGAYWNWDVRQTSIVVLLALYGAYFALRRAVNPEERGAVFSASYSILAFPSVPLFGFIVPRLYNSLHPEDTLISDGRIALGGTVLIIFIASLVSFALLFYWLYNIRWRTLYLERQLMERYYE